MITITKFSDIVQFILDDFFGEYEAFKKITTDLGLISSEIEDQEKSAENPFFNDFLEDLVEATDEGFLARTENSELDLRNFYSQLFARLVQDEKAAERIHFNSGDWRRELAIPPRVVIEFCSNSTEEWQNLEQLVGDMLSYIEAEPRLIGALLNLEGVNLVWIEREKPGLVLRRENIHLFRFEWSSFDLKYMIESKIFGKPVLEVHPDVFKSFCRFYMLVDLLNKVIHLN